MSESLNDVLSSVIKKIGKLSMKQEKEIISLLEHGLTTVIDYISKTLLLKPIISTRIISIGKVKEESSLYSGIKRTDDKIIFGKWLFKLIPEKKSTLLYFLLLKEGFSHFFGYIYDEISEMVLNTIATLHFMDLRNINPEFLQFALITNQYSVKEVAGDDFILWLNYLILLFTKNISPSNIFQYYFSIIKTENNLFQRAELFKKWILEQTYQEEDTIAPIYLNHKLLALVNLFIKISYQDFSFRKITKQLEIHSDTLRNRLRDLGNYRGCWMADINYKKILLNRYFLKIESTKKTNFDSLINYLLEIPYLNILFKGQNQSSEFLYSPRFVCPHIIADKLTYTLNRYQEKGFIKNFNIQLVNQLTHYYTIVNSPVNPSLDFFVSAIDNEIFNLNKYAIQFFKLDEKHSYVSEMPMIDRNLLFLLSMIRGKYLTKGKIIIDFDALEDLYIENNISFTDDKARNDLINQLEIRARRRGFIDYHFYIRNIIPRGFDILIMELENNNSNLEDLIERFRIFSFLGRIDLSNHIILTLPGISHTHPVSNLLQKVVNQHNITSQFYSINLVTSRHIPLYDLFDFKEKKWKI